MELYEEAVDVDVVPSSNGDGEVMPSREIGSKLLGKFIERHLRDYGANARMARELNVTPATITNWASARMSPDFESCIKLARYFNVTPLDIFRMAGKPKYKDQFEHIVSLITGVEMKTFPRT